VNTTTEHDRLDMESTGWQGWSRRFGTLRYGDLKAPAPLKEAQLDDESQPVTEIYPLVDEPFAADSADGWGWL
jgi:hypothetical protein